MNIKQCRNSTTAIRLRKAMNDIGKKQVDLVNETGLNKSAISRYLSGEYEPKQDAIYKLALALDVSEMWLWGYDVPKDRTAEQKEVDKKAAFHKRLLNDAELLQSIEEYYSLETDMREFVRKTIHNLAEAKSQ